METLIRQYGEAKTVLDVLTQVFQELEQRAPDPFAAGLLAGVVNNTSHASRLIERLCAREVRDHADPSPA